MFRFNAEIYFFNISAGKLNTKIEVKISSSLFKLIKLNHQLHIKFLKKAKRPALHKNVPI